MSRIKSWCKLIYRPILWIFNVFKVILMTISFFFKTLGVIVKFVIKIFHSFIDRIKKLFRFSLTFKITFVYGFVISLILFLSGISILSGFRFFLIHQAKEDIKIKRDIIADYMGEDLEIPIDKISTISKHENLIITVFDGNREIIHSSNNNSTMEIFFHNNFNSPSIVTDHDNEFVVLNNKIHLNDNTIYLQLMKSLIPENTLLIILFIILVASGIIGIIVIIVLGFKLSKKMLQPIGEMTETVKAITLQNLDTRLDVGGAYDELRDLAVTFNEMFDRIQASYEKQNQFVADASHELRTPISVIQGYINLLDRWGKGDKEVLDESIVAIKGESKAMKDLIEKLLFLARSDKSLLKLQRENFYVGELIDEIIYETTLIDLDHEIIGRTHKNVILNADRKLLKQSIRIFIDNSLKFTPRGGRIEISSSLQKKELLIVVEDTGIGISKEDIDLIFNRFYRSDKSRTKETGGHGLGMSIAKLIIDEHGGYIKVESKVNVGTKIKIFLPWNKDV